MRIFAAWLVFATVVFGTTTIAYPRCGIPPREARTTAAAGQLPAGEATAAALPTGPLGPLFTQDPPGTFTWRGVHRGNTDIFEVPSGTWSYCPRIVTGPVEAHTGMRASLYAADGLWVTADFGAGGPGPLGCTPIPAAGKYEVKVFASPDYVTWKIVVRRSEPGDSTQPQLSGWRTDYMVPTRPTSKSDSSYAFEAFDMVITPRFDPGGKPWKFCWELYATPAPANPGSSNAFFEVELYLEDEVGTFGVWKNTDRLNGDSGCIDMESRQRRGRHHLIIREGSPTRSARVTISGVQWLQ